MTLYRVIEDCLGIFEMTAFNTLQEAQAFVEPLIEGLGGKWVSQYRWEADDVILAYEIVIS